jgi:hypothetical protein
MFHVPEKYRDPYPAGYNHASTAADGNNGSFRIKTLKFAKPFLAIASDGELWEHVSVSTPHATPSWSAMCFIKDLFWDPEDCVVQYHPPQSTYVNNHTHCLHLWRKIGSEFELPPSCLVGDSRLGTLI